MRQQSWIRLLNIDHCPVIAETAASLVRGFEVEAAVGSARKSERRTTEAN
jgi:hypothetical protein